MSTAAKLVNVMEAGTTGEDRLLTCPWRSSSDNADIRSDGKSFGSVGATVAEFGMGGGYGDFYDGESLNLNLVLTKCSFHG